ncbi:MAG: hypothetical protein KIS92_07625 [Planctomycetota bacterium]|nr:hypothetical protein [Planctomycetota bacterium]
MNKPRWRPGVNAIVKPRNEDRLGHRDMVGVFVVDVSENGDEVQLRFKDGRESWESVFNWWLIRDLGETSKS